MKKITFSLLFSFLLFFVGHSQCYIPDDPGFNNPPNHPNGHPEGQTNAFELHNVFCAWEITHGDPNIVVAVYDSYHAFPHDDLDGKIVDFDYSPSNNLNHHGLSACGIIAAIPDNQIGCAGVGYNTKVAQYDLGFMLGPNANYDHAVNQDIDIINLSLRVDAGYQETLDFVNSGGVVITAAGDSDHDEIFDIPGVINVGRCHWTSNDGFSHLDYHSPNVADIGIDIYGYAFDQNRLTSYQGFNLTNNGTSSLAPMVAGTVALMKSVNPNLTPGEIECIIKMSAKSEVKNSPAGNYNKLLDVEAAVIAAQNWPNISKGDEIVLSGQGTVHLEDITAPGDIRIPTGSDVTFLANINLLHPKANIIVERGAKLTLNGSVVDAGSCLNVWRGFIVEGNSSKSQPNINDVLTADDAGVLILRNCDINNASNAISTYANYLGALSAQFRGGLVDAENVRFNNNGRSFEFMKYDYPENSIISNCTFTSNSKHVITAWRTRGLTIENNTFSDYDDSGIFNATAVFNASGNVFQGKGTGLLDYNYGIDINNSTSTVNLGAYKIENNVTQDNLIGIKFEGTDQLNPFSQVPYGLTMSNNEFLADDFGVYGQGSDSYRISQNTISSFRQAIILQDGGNSRNILSDNLIGANLFGLELINDNDLLRFYRNCFDLMPPISSARDVGLSSTLTEQFSLGLQYTIELGPNLFQGPDNCYQEVSKNIASSTAASNVPLNSFGYGNDPSTPLQDCRVPDPSGNPLFYDYFDSEAVDAGCTTTPPASGGIFIPPIYCEIPEKEGDIRQHIQSLENSITTLEANNNQSFIDIHHIRKLERCLEEANAKLIELLLEHDRFIEISNEYIDETNPKVLTYIVSNLINNNKYSDALSFMHSANNGSIEWKDFIKSEEILINFLNSHHNFELTSTDKDFLINASNQTHYYAPFIRGVYAEITGESILSSHFHDEVFIRSSEGNDDISEELKSVLYPTLANTDIILEGIEGAIKVLIYNTSGTLESSIDKFDNSISINIHNFNSGIYFVKVIFSDIEVETHRFIKI